MGHGWKVDKGLGLSPTHTQAVSYLVAGHYLIQILLLSHPLWWRLEIASYGSILGILWWHLRHLMVTSCGGILWWNLMVASCSGILWWRPVVTSYGGILWWHLRHLMVVS